MANTFTCRFPTQKRNKSVTVTISHLDTKCHSKSDKISWLVASLQWGKSLNV
eukprot:m.4862 g.4862  ORF g.4862 m.4862 type:complete len:52 (+) comp11449_c0_seq1:1505-1660(+)